MRPVHRRRARRPQRDRVRCALSGVLALAAAGIAVPGLSSADTFKQLNVIVNQLDGAGLPADLTERQKEINDIYKSITSGAIGSSVREERRGSRRSPDSIWSTSSGPAR